MATSGSGGQIIRDSTPGIQATNFSIGEWHNSGEITEDLQSGTITHQFTVQGNPAEAMRSQPMQGMELGTPHPWFGAVSVPTGLTAEGLYAGSYLVSRTLRHLVKQKVEAKRRTLVTLVYKKRPCLGGFEEERIGTLISMPMWWSFDDPPESFTGSAASINVLVPSEMLKRRYPIATATRGTIARIKAHQGTLNGLAFAGESPLHWLLYSVNTKLLWGDPKGVGAYEITLMFLADRIRHHAYWSPLFTTGAILKKPTAPFPFQGYFDAHRIRRRYPISVVNWEALVPPRLLIGECHTPSD